MRTRSTVPPWVASQRHSCLSAARIIRQLWPPRYVEWLTSAEVTGALLEVNPFVRALVMRWPAPQTASSCRRVIALKPTNGGAERGPAHVLSCLELRQRGRRIVTPGRSSRSRNRRSSPSLHRRSRHLWSSPSRTQTRRQRSPSRSHTRRQSMFCTWDFTAGWSAANLPTPEGAAWTANGAHTPRILAATTTTSFFIGGLRCSGWSR